ncbi:MAG TPA: UDP-N-acetylglucosamine--N-acetylmuramyl-(pentapeptide) pyrophosphoryl-undecaprenol N-acetylglucosamine transferase [Microbacteriaceae bacterium]|nr:UDP-N-acetylglucosamine--N-acetylmuramyl-(pentapeptide) pyrophosphoryl-undecaprenol N-acetylglucosamine transferase [Microbacteriaceae bacterium]
MTVYLLAGGGTAGHVNPLLAIADRLREREPSDEILILGTAEGLEARLVPERGYELLTVERLPFPRRPSLAALRFPSRYRAAVRRVERMIQERGIDVVIGVGGYASAPAYSAAHRRGVPIVLHEANARPGFANRLGARWAAGVGLAFRGTPLRARDGLTEFVGMPLRTEIERLAAPGARALARPEAIAFFGLDAQRPVLLVTGGSSGAQRINDAIAGSVEAIIATGWQVLHLTGEYRDALDSDIAGYHPVRYADRMDLALAAADAAVSRAGTSTVAELAALGIPTVFVPYAAGNGEQRLNAAVPVEAGGALLIEDAAFSADRVRSDLVGLLADRARIAAMGERMRAVGIGDATDRMVALIDRAVPGT